MIEQVEPLINDVKHVVDSVDDRVKIIEQDLKEQEEAFSQGGPFNNPAKHLKYLERRQVLSERSILKLEQILNLYKNEKK